MTEQERPQTEAGLAMIRDCAAWGIDPALAATSVIAIEAEGRQQAMPVEILAKAIDEHVAEECPFDACFGECARPILDRVARLNASESPCRCAPTTCTDCGNKHRPHEKCPEGDASESPPTRPRFCVSCEGQHDPMRHELPGDAMTPFAMTDEHDPRSVWGGPAVGCTGCDFIGDSWDEHPAVGDASESGQPPEAKR